MDETPRRRLKQIIFTMEKTEKKVLRLDSHFGNFQELEKLLNEGWDIERADILTGNNFSKYTSTSYIVYILTKKS